MDDFFAGLLVDDDPVYARAEAAVSPLQGKLLYLLAKAINASAILELGTLTGYSTIWLARALPPKGRLTTIERDEAGISTATENVRRAGLADRVDLVHADALQWLMRGGRGGPFDLVFLDADKRDNPAYLDHALALSHPGTLIVADNVVRSGDVVQRNSDDARVQGIRRFTEQLANDPRVTATAIQTVGVKGHDGFVVALVTDAG